MATYTPETFIQKLDKVKADITSAEREIMFKVARVINSDKSERIFTRGLNQNGRNIGKYSTKPIRISSKNSPRSFGSKTKYFAGGYKAFKVSIGRGERVNLRLFGNLQNDYVSSLTYRNNEWQEGVKRQENVDKIQVLQNKYGQVFNFTKTEEKKAQQLLAKLLLKYMQ